MNAAQGYMELGLLNEGLKELDGLSSEEQRNEYALQLRLLILMRSHDWSEGLKVSETLREVNPALSIGYIHGAFCLHELGETQQAKEMLLAGPESLKGEATFFYNLGCYEASLGNKEDAGKYVRKSIQMNSEFRDIAQHDPDLAPIRELLK